MSENEEVLKRKQKKVKQVRRRREEEALETTHLCDALLVEETTKTVMHQAHHLDAVGASHGTDNRCLDQYREQHVSEKRKRHNISKQQRK